MDSLLAAPTTILLTGASSGIGAALAEQLAVQGHRVIGVSRTASRTSALTAAYDCDLSDPAAVVSLCERLDTAHPDIGVIINNAAVQHARRLEDSEVDHLVSEASLNLVAPALIARAFLPRLRKRRGLAAILNVGSGLAFFPKESSTLYCATKAGLHSLSTSLRYQCEGSNVLICEAILPLVDTPMTAGRGRGKITAAQAAQAMIDGLKAGRTQVFIGKARFLPILQRVAPGIGRRALRRG